MCYPLFVASGEGSATDREEGVRPVVWRPPVEPSAAEQAVVKAVRRARLFVFLREHKHPRSHPSSLPQSARYVLQHPMLYRAVLGQFLLRFFYAWMVIYMPLYLVELIGAPLYEDSVAPTRLVFQYGNSLVTHSRI